MAASSYTVLEDTLMLESGLRRLHLMSIGQPVDVALAMRELAPAQSRDWYIDGNEYEEGKAVKRYHVDLVYAYRNTIRLHAQGCEADQSKLINAVMWRRTGVERWSAVIQDAADIYWGNYDSAPALALLNTLPKNAPKELTLAGCCEGQKIMLLALAWVPVGCAIVCGRDWLEGVHG